MKLSSQKLIDNVFYLNETIAQYHVNGKKFGRYLCKSGFMRGNTNSDACFESLESPRNCQHVNDK